MSTTCKGRSATACRAASPWRVRTLARRSRPGREERPVRRSRRPRARLIACRVLNVAPERLIVPLGWARLRSFIDRPRTVRYTNALSLRSAGKNVDDPGQHHYEHTE